MELKFSTHKLHSKLVGVNDLRNKWDKTTLGSLSDIAYNSEWGRADLLILHMETLWFL